MNLLLNDEQTMLKNGAHEFFKARMPVKLLRELRDRDAPQGFDGALWGEMAALGWAGILIPEVHGGAGFGYKGVGQVMEAAGRTLAATPLASSAVLAAPLLLAAGNVTQQAKFLPAIAAGELLIALALDEAPRHAPSEIATRAEASGAGFVLNGRKTFVVDGHVASRFIVVARSHGERDARPGCPCSWSMPKPAACSARARAWSIIATPPSSASTMWKSLPMPCSAAWARAMRR